MQPSLPAPGDRTGRRTTGPLCPSRAGGPRPPGTGGVQEAVQTGVRPVAAPVPWKPNSVYWPAATEPL